MREGNQLASPPGDAEPVRLRDGETLFIRPIRPDDAARLLAFHARLSPETIYARYMSPHPEFQPGELDRLVNLDFRTRAAFVATTGDDEERIVAVARYVVASPRRPHEAEVAFVVEDGYQSRGLGARLMDRLAAHARGQGIGVFIADVLPENSRMVRLMRRLGVPESARGGSGRHIRVKLEGVSAPPSRVEQGGTAD